MGITTKEIAKICGVSRTTVHRALNNTGRISEKTKSGQNLRALAGGRGRM